MEKKVLDFDVIILGGGPGGFSAGIYATRGALKTAIVDISMMGGAPSNYLELENYPGFPLIGGFELMEKFEEQADKFGVDKYSMQEIQSVDLATKTIETLDYTFRARAIIIATGAQAKKLGIEGEAEFLGRGVSYCAVCDGAFYKDKEVCVVGGGNAAVEEAMYLTKFAKKVRIIHRRDALRADKIVQERAFKNENLEFIWNAVPVEIKGDKTVESFIIKDVQTDELKEIKTDGVFPYIGFSPNSGDFNGQIRQDDAGFIHVDENMQTSIAGVFAIGDVRVTPLRQVITAAADGAIAACAAVKHIEELEFEILTK